VKGEGTKDIECEGRKKGRKEGKEGEGRKKSE
jgi:hypothetical protein